METTSRSAGKRRSHQASVADRAAEGYTNGSDVRADAQLSALLGALTGASGVSAEVGALLGTGFCGALTTFSTFGADVVRLVDLRRLLAAVGYVAATLVLGLGAAAVAWVLASGPA